MIKESIIESRKYYKRNKVLNIIRNGHNVSRYQLQKETSYSMTTILSTVEELLEDNLIYEKESTQSRVGRKPVWLRINPSGGYFIGVEFNAHNLHCAMLNFSGETIYTSSTSLHHSDSLDLILDKIKKEIQKAKDTLNEKKQNCIFGIGIGLPGYFDQENGVGLHYNDLPAWKNVPIRKIIESEFQVTCYIENNVNGMGLAYKRIYHRTDPIDFLFVSIRTGVRVIPVVDGELLSGRSGSAGQLGHTRVSGSTRKCHCGKSGCLNTEVSEMGIYCSILEGYLVGRRYQDLMKMIDNDCSKINIDVFLKSIQKGHPDSLALLRQSAEYLGEALGIMVDIFSPDQIVLSGKIFQVGNFFIQSLDDCIRKNSIQENSKNLKLVVSPFSENIGAIGAAELVMQKEFEFIDKNI